HARWSLAASPIAAAAPGIGPRATACSTIAKAMLTGSAPSVALPGRVASAPAMTADPSRLPLGEGQGEGGAGAPEGPLVGLRVLDIATMIAAPFSAALFADCGAEVIKVELPGHGDALRKVAPMAEGRSLYWSVLGRNKHSVSLDLRVPRGRELFLELVKR